MYFDRVQTSGGKWNVVAYMCCKNIHFPRKRAAKTAKTAAGFNAVEYCKSKPPPQPPNVREGALAAAKRRRTRSTPRRRRNRPVFFNGAIKGSHPRLAYELQLRANNQDWTARIDDAVADSGAQITIIPLARFTLLGLPRSILSKSWSRAANANSLAILGEFKGVISAKAKESFRRKRKTERLSSVITESVFY